MNKIRLLIVLIIIPLLTGCLYPKELRNQNMPTNDEQLERVQMAVNQYREETDGLLPIYNRDSDVDIFIKYPIDFSKLKERNILGETPKNSYEQGGYYTYVIINPEEDATVKVVDVRVTQKLQSISYDVMLYINKNNYLPFKEVLFNNYFTIDNDLLKYKEDDLFINSPYTNNQLEVILDPIGKTLIDYRPDVYQLIQKHEIDEYEGDLRYLLTEYYPFAPAFSPPMYLEDGQIVFKYEN